MSLVKIKDFNALIDIIDKGIFWSTCEKQTRSVWKMSRNVKKRWLYNLLDYSYHQNHYKLIGIDLPKQTNTTSHQQINLIGKLGGNNGAAMFFYSWKAAKNYFKLFFRFIKCNRIM